VQVNGTSTNNESLCTLKIPIHTIDVKSSASTRHGPKKTYSSKKGLKNNGHQDLLLKQYLVGWMHVIHGNHLSWNILLKKWELASVCVFFIHGLDDDLVKQQWNTIFRVHNTFMILEIMVSYVLQRMIGWKILIRIGD